MLSRDEIRNHATALIDSVSRIERQARRVEQAVKPFAGADEVTLMLSSLIDAGAETTRLAHRAVNAPADTALIVLLAATDTQELMSEISVTMSDEARRIAGIA